MGARLGGRRLAGADGRTRRQGRSRLGDHRARTAGPGRGMAEAGRGAHGRRVAGPRQAGPCRRGGQRRPARRHRHAHRRHRQAAGDGLPRLRRPQPARAAVGGGGASPAPRRRSPRAVPRHARMEADARGDLHLGRHQDRHALGALRPRHAGTDPRGGGAALRARWRCLGGRRRSQVCRPLEHRAGQSPQGQRTAAVRYRPRPCALQGPVRSRSRT